MKKSYIEKIKRDLTEVAEMQAKYNEMLREIHYLESAIPAKESSIKEDIANIHQSFTGKEIEEIINSQSMETELSYSDWCDHSNPQMYYGCNSFDELKLDCFLRSFLKLKDYIDIETDKALSILQSRLLPFDALAPSTQHDLLEIGAYYNSDELNQLVKKYCASASASETLVVSI